MSIHPYPGPVLGGGDPTNNLDVDKTWSDTISAVTEAWDLAASAEFTLLESAPLTENYSLTTQNRDTPKAYPETLTATEAFSYLGFAFFQDNESVTLQDVFSLETQDRTTARPITDTLTVIEAFDQLGFATFDVGESAPLSEAYVRQTQDRTTARPISDQIAASESFSQIGIGEFQTDEVIQLTESYVRQTQSRTTAKSYSETLTATESFAKAVFETRATSESASLNESYQRTTENRSEQPTITQAGQDIDGCAETPPEQWIFAALSHENGSKQIRSEWKNGVGGSWTGTQFHTAGSTEITITGVDEDTDIYIRVAYAVDLVYDEDGPIDTTGCSGPPGP